MNLPNQNRENKVLVILATFFLVLAGLISLTYILAVLRGILIPFVMGAIIAYALYPLPKLLFNKYKIPKWLSITVIYLVGLSLILGFLLNQVPVIIEQIQQIVTNLPGYLDKLKNYPETINKTFDEYGIDFDIKPYTGYLISSLESISKTALGFLANSLTSMIANILKILLTIILSIYMLADADKIVNFFRNIIFRNYTERFDSVTGIINNVMRGYLRGMLLLSLIVGVLQGGAAYVLGMKYAFTIGCIVAIFDLIPFVGPIIAIIISGIVALYQSLLLSIIIVCIFTFVQYLENQFFRPMIQGESVGVHPLAIFLALFLGANLWGVVGLFLSIPLVGILYKILLFYELADKKTIEENKIPTENSQHNRHY